ncbi:AMP-binding protein [Sinorhizobium medicae]|nr:AMP-binding protein [Sinorhizobium medicae]
MQHLDDYEAEFEATHAQRRFRAMETLTGASPALPLAIELHGRFSKPALAASLAAALRDYDVLRSAFWRKDEHWRLRVARHVAVEISLVDLSGLTAELSGDLAAKRLAQVSRRPLQAAAAPLLRAAVFRLRSDRHILQLVIHHALVDEWSMQLIARRLAEGYSASRSGLPFPRYSAPPFHVVAPKLEARIEDERGRRALAFWKVALDGAPTHFAPPPDMPRTGRPGSGVARVTRRFRPGLGSALEASPLGLVTTRFAVLAASLALLLGRLADSRDIVLAISTTGRRHRDIAAVVGPLMNTIVLRVNFEDVRSLADAATRTMRALAPALAHADVPVDVLYDAMRLTADTSAAPVAQILLSQRADMQAPLDMPGLIARSIETRPPVTSFDLTFSIANDGPDLLATCDYVEELYERETVERQLAYWEAILEHGLLSPDGAIGALGVPQRTPAPERCPDSLLARLAAAAGQRPDAVALVDLCAGAALTHAALAKISDEIAHGLVTSGVRQGATVGVCLPRGLMLWCTLVGVLKAGCTYVPLHTRDPPRTRVGQADTANIALMACDGLSIEAFSEARVICVTVETLRARGAKHTEPLPPPLPPIAAAYVAQTSGSTGVPKWVEVPHRALAAALDAFDAPEFFTNCTRLLSITDPSFDIAALEVFGPLYAGGCALLAAEGAGGDGHGLAALLRASEANALQATPFTWSQLMAADWRGHSCPLALCGGEAAEPKLASWLAGLPGGAYNVYGPTETAIWSAVGPMCGREGGDLLGGSLPGEALHVLDGTLEPTPEGGLGELYIGGVGLANGYRGNPAATARAFLPDPFADAPGARMYRTGDRVRLDIHGGITFRGRVDGQTKIRGVRIELDGVARCLAEHPAVKACVATVAVHERRGRVIVAYLLVSGQSEEAVHAVRRFARERLPPHCIPAAFVPMQAFPTTITNKIDRRRLPAPEERHFTQSSSAAGPRTPSEQVIAAIWSETLGDVSFSVEDDFFAIGGSSLDAVQVASRIAEHLLPDFTFAMFLDAPTVAEVARRVDAGGISRSANLVMRAGGACRRTALSPFLRVRVARVLSLRGRQDVNIRQLLRLRGPFRSAKLEHAVRVLSARHEALRTRFGLDDDGPYLQAEPAWSAEPHIHEIDMSGLGAAEAARIASRFASRPFDLRCPPLFRFGLFRLGPQDHVLAVAASHLVADGWSLAVIARELEELYARAERPCSPHDGAPVLQFADVVAWQNRWLSSEGFAEDLRFWIRQFASPPAVLFHPGKNRRSKTRFIEHVFGADLPELVGRTARRLACTPFACVLACLFRSLYRLTGERDISVITPAANRGDPGLRSTVGLVMNPIVLRHRVADASIGNAVTQVWRDVRAANQHQRLPLEVVLDALERVDRRRSTPLSQVFVLWDEVGLRGLSLPSVDVVPLPDPRPLLPHDVPEAPALQFDLVYGASGLMLTLTHRIDAVDEASAAYLLSLLKQELTSLSTIH